MMARWAGRGEPSEIALPRSTTPPQLQAAGIPQEPEARPILLVGPVENRRLRARQVREVARPDWAIITINVRTKPARDAITQEGNNTVKPRRTWAERGRRLKWQFTDRSRFSVQGSIATMFADTSVAVDFFTGPKFPDTPIDQYLVQAAATAQKKGFKGLLLSVDNAHTADPQQLKDLLDAVIEAEHRAGAAITIVLTADLPQLTQHDEFDKEYFTEFAIHTAPHHTPHEARNYLTQGTQHTWTPEALNHAIDTTEGRLHPLED
ncbi:MAG: hypothetical protein ACRC0L_03215, partial [Angustibacter sp.]